MRKSIHAMLLSGTAMLTLLGTTASAAPAHPLKGEDYNPLGRMRKPVPAHKWSGGLTLSQKQQRISPNFTSPASDEFQYLYAPDGTEWYAVCSYDSEKIRHKDEYSDYTETILKGFKYTIYDDQFNEVGTVSDKIELEEGEIRCAQVMLDYTLTKNFFNNDGNYEVMVAFSMNTPDHTVNIRTKAYSIEKTPESEYSTPIAVIPGYPIDAVNCARDRWSEDFYITFLTEEEGNPDDYQDYIDFLGSMKQVMTTYGKGSRVVMQRTIRMLDLPGDQMNSPGMLCKNVDGKLTLIYAQYEKSFFENPAGMYENENINPDNKLVIEVYQMKDSYTKEMELVSTTKIDAIQNTENPDVYCTFYGIGTLMWDQDVDYGNYSNDGRPTFVVTVDDCLYHDDDHYNSGYHVYDADGNRIKTIAEDTYGYVIMSDLPGYEPQAMFILTENKNFQFVDLYSCRKVTEVEPAMHDLGLTTSLDRVPIADGYAYASALSSGTTIDGVNVAAPVCWFDTNGEIIRVDKIPVGEDVELAQIYMNSDALNPYVFNTDNNLEYLLLVKRRMTTGELREELLISSPESGVLYTFTDQEDGKGAIRSVFLMPGTDPLLIIAYLNDDDKFTADSYALPLTKFAGGTGTAENPYLIASAGDLQQIKTAPGACYKLSSDIDCGTIFFQPIENFSGTLDGDGHTVSNLKIPTPTNGKTGIFKACDNATVKNIDFYNSSLILSGAYEAGLITATASGSTFDNIHVLRLTATGDNYGGEFGGIAGKMWTRTNVIGCEVAGADINLPSCPSAGGISGDIRTGCTITACAFSGNMTAQSTLGGIVGSTTTGDEIISQCHVNANLKAENTVGGIVGFLDRSKVKNNYVEGTIEATKPSKWTKSIGLGGIAGELEGDWQGKADVPVTGNMIGVSALIAPDMTGTIAAHPRQLETVHRVVGRSSYNSYFEEEPSKIVYEQGVYNNLIVSDLAAIDPKFTESIEGTTTDSDKLTQDTLEKFGFAYGTTNEAPWNAESSNTYDPSLYYESILYIPTQEIYVEKGETFEVAIAILSLEELAEETIMDDFVCEYDESIMQPTGNMSFDGKTVIIELIALNSGESRFSASILGETAGCLVTVGEQNSVAGIESAGSSISVENGCVKAQGCKIMILDIAGKAILKGRDEVNIGALAAGIYIATATDCKGNRASLKFVK